MSDYNCDYMPVEDAAKIIFNDLRVCTPVMRDTIAEKIAFHILELDIYERGNFAKRLLEAHVITDEQLEEMNRKYRDIHNQTSEMDTAAELAAIIKPWLDTIFVQNVPIFEVEYGDSHGHVVPVLENDDTFKAIPHITISNH